MKTLRARLFVCLWLAGTGQAAGQQQARFDHTRHARLFPSCASCHAGAAMPSQSLWPDPASCAACHDGSIQRTVQWIPPGGARHSNLRFSHATHPSLGARGSTSCTTCHAEGSPPAITVRRAVVERCLDCHGIPEAHLAAGNVACASCHQSLPQATSLTREDIARFPVPPYHRLPGFGTGGHAVPARSATIACATCHAREFCSSCHVNAPEQPVIQSLASDPRSLAIGARLAAPASHRDPEFLRRHGAMADRNPGQCSTCHTRESCATCHTASPRVARALPAASAGRASGARIVRRPPASHVAGFRENHGPDAEAAPANCNACHARTQCTECHRPAAGSGAGGYHPAGFLERHPAAAYARETSCASCHNALQFCTSCHVTSGLRSARAQLGAGYHDARRFFLLGHGPAARQGLESCVSCHAERDCLACHAAQGGRRFNPHGPGFDAARLRAKNPEMCTACHGTSIPGD